MTSTHAGGLVACATSSPEAWIARSRAVYARSHDWNERGDRILDLYRQLWANGEQPDQLLVSLRLLT